MESFVSRHLTKLCTAWCLIHTAVFAQSPWRSSLYPTNWQPPASTVSFASDKLIQDFSYAGYRRGEAFIPTISGPIFNVTDYGAVPNGNNDNTVEIQNAINAAASAGGGVVWLPAGVYRISPQGSNSHCLRISTNDIVLRGAGTSQTFLLNTSKTMNGRSVIQVSPASSPGTGTARAITSNLLGPTRRIPVENASSFSPGNMVQIRWEFTSDWVAENNQQTWWGTAQPADATYLREVTATNSTAGWIEVDVPTRYWIKTRDNPTVRTISGLLRNVAIESLSIGNVQITETGWGEEDYTDSTKAAYDAHASWLIRMQNTRDSWISGVNSYQVSTNTSTCHLLSNGILLSSCTRITVRDCEMRRPQYGGGGGNGYMYRLQSSNDCLVRDCIADFSRHGFVISHAGTSGNVFHKCEDRNTARATGSSSSGYTTDGSGSDNHQHFSHSNLWDQCHAHNSFYTAHHRITYGGTPSHGLTSAHAVYWNTTGSGTRFASSGGPIVRSEQLEYGYIIGTRATDTNDAYFTSNPTGGNTSPADHREGVNNTGHLLQPQSLFLDQVSRRLRPVITFAANGGSATTPASVQLTFGDPYGTLPGTTRSGFLFVGWFTASSGGTQVTATTTITNSANHTLHAQWNAIPTVNAGPNQSLALNQLVLWSPLSTTTAGWYDAADATTITATNNAVSLWRDKSGNQNHAAQSTSSQRPTTGSQNIGGLNAIAFNPTNNQFLSAPHSASLHLDATGGANLFAVFRTSGFINRGSGLNSIVSKGELLSAGAAYGIRINTNHQLPFKASADLLSTPPDTLIAQNLIYSGTRDDASKTALTFINGSQRSIATQTTITSNNTTALILGGETNTARCADVSLGEFLIVPGSLAAPQRQKFEGCLAHKWSLSTNLAADHRYRTSPPLMPAATIALNGAANDPDQPLLTVGWSLVSGPAAVSFGNAATSTTSATFARPGTYVLRLTASDGVSTRTDDLTVTVGGFQSSNPFVFWALEPASSFLIDYNRDSIADGLAWLLGAETPTANATTLLPLPSRENDRLTMTFRYRSASARGIYSLRLQHSSTLAADSWTNVTIPDVSSTVDGVDFTITPLPGGGIHQIKATIPPGSSGKVFLRLATTMPSP